MFIRLLEAIAAHTSNEKYRTALLRHAEMIERGSREGVLEELDRNDVKSRYQAAVRALQ